ncbi:MAG: 2-amino-4-hydroxy-6-hydroxymethyldihydropteridine diphosphokinase [Candidatus Omnitrophota bacterium]|nr:2-amino-4-hydroxy-6-hydroxymethyldihydropteridine diphosphokinase [Candidatus Omnitrophota bacterium]MDZ4241526.1 2-amino-4-hydroxy-6-hydroxymethyldihydropteridine diphosphokinase [Candidatus Omnitrophota bacterium]
MNTAVIGLGSNIQPKTNIAKAKDILARRYTLLAESKFVRTTAIGPGQQSDFLNGAVLLRTSLGRQRLKIALGRIEKLLGRTERQKGYVPRPIDLDIVVWNGKVVHPDFHTRKFLKASVLELLPNLKD